MDVVAVLTLQRWAGDTEKDVVVNVAVPIVDVAKSTAFPLPSSPDGASLRWQEAYDFFEAVGYVVEYEDQLGHRHKHAKQYRLDALAQPVNSDL